MNELNGTLATNYLVSTDDKAKLTWETPEILELDFQNTQSGMGAFPEGTAAGFPIGSES